MNTLQPNLTNSFYTKFYPALQAFTGSTISSLIIGKLEFWFENPKYSGGFYKFVEPCQSPLYKEGDSWAEELGVSRKLFAKAFDIIGVRYKSKSAYLNSEDKFQGKLYASYHDRQTNRTYFIRNHGFVSQLLEGLFRKKKPPKETTESQNKPKGPESPSVEKNLPAETSLTKTSALSASSDASQGRSWNGDLGRSCAGVPSYIHKKTSSVETEQKSSSDTLDAPENKVTEEMIKIWNEEIGELGVSVSKGLSTRLYEAFNDLFNRSIDAWVSYCQTISSSKFLMGEAQNKFFKKAWITWAIRKENIERVLTGEFQLGDRKTNQDRRVEEIDQELRNTEYKTHQIEYKISHIKSEVRERRKNIVKEKIKNLSLEEKHDLEKDFKLFLEEQNNEMTKEFKNFRWKGLFMTTYFEGFVEDKIYDELFKTTDEKEAQEAVENSGFLELLDDVRKELTFLRKRRKDLENSKTTWHDQKSLSCGSAHEIFPCEDSEGGIFHEGHTCMGHPRGNSTYGGPTRGNICVNNIHVNHIRVDHTRADSTC